MDSIRRVIAVAGVVGCSRAVFEKKKKKQKKKLIPPFFPSFI